MSGRDPNSVVADGLCIGCGACAAMFPRQVRMELGTDGFVVAQHDTPLTNVDSKRFRRVCPAGGYPRPTGIGGASHPLWGRAIGSFDGFAEDADVRDAGSSGGVITAVVAGLLDAGEVDAVVGVRASSEDAFANEVAVVRRSRDIARIAGSRYSPASPVEGLAGVRRGERVAFVGKPCDVAAARRLVSAGGDAPDIRVFLSFFCARTPSWNATKRAVVSLGIPVSRTKSVRYRGNGWPGRFTAVDSSGDSASMSYEESWGTILNQELHTRCKLCLDGVGALADIVCADSWDTDSRGYPVFETQAGRSLVIARTETGLATLRRLREASIQLHERSLEGVGRIQPSQVTRKKWGVYRAMGYRLAGHAVPWFRGFPKWRWLLSSPTTAARQLVGAFRRARKGGV